MIDHFNAYVRGPLRDSVVNLLGREIDMPFKLLFVFNIPIWCLCLAEIFGCDGNTDCEETATREGYMFVPQYILGNAVVNMLTPVAFAFVFPLALRAIDFVAMLVTGKIWRMVLGSIVVTLLFVMMNSIQAALAGAFVVIVAKYSTLWLVAFLIACALMGVVATPLHFISKPVSSFYPIYQMPKGSPK